jgi:sec-independent protein translocase protein TatA
VEFSITHLLFLMAVILLFFGPSRLPAMGKSLGEAIRSFKKGLDKPEIDVTEDSKKVKEPESGPKA